MRVFKNILVPIDFSPFSLAALPYARAAGERLVLVHAASDRESVGDAPDRLEALARSLAPMPAEAIVDIGSPVPILSRYARDKQADLVVMSTHGRSGVRRALMGSTAEGMMRHGPCPVLTVRGASMPPFPPRRIVVPTDLSDYSLLAVGVAELMGGEDAEIVLAHFVSVPAFAERTYGAHGATRERYTESASRELQRILPGLPDRVTPVTEVGPPVAGTLALARERSADLIVIASHGLSGVFRMLLGSTAEGIMREAPCPVLTCRARPVF